MKKYNTEQIQNYKNDIHNAKCIYIYGSDAFQRDRAFKIVFNLLTNNEPSSDNSFLFFGYDFVADEKITTIIDSLNMISFDMSEKTIAIKYFEQLNTKAATKIAKYTDNPSPYAKLILVSDIIESKANVYKNIKDNCMFIETSEMKYQSHLLYWLNNYIRDNRIRMDEPAKQYFSTVVEPNSYIAYNEMKKLELYVGINTTITTNHIKECTITSKTNTIFELIDAVGFKQKEKALKIAENLIENQESVIMIVSMLTNFFFTLWKLDALRRKGVSHNELTSKHMNDIYFSFRDKYSKFIQNYNQSQIHKALKQLYICDCRAKLSMADEKVLITALLLMLFLV